MSLTFSDRPASTGGVFVIAEAGVNHNGSIETALQMADAARAAGADAVKFQVFSASRLATAGAPTAAYQQVGGAGQDQRALLAGLELARDEFRRIAAHCRKVGVAFLATPYDPADLEFLVRLGVPALKIASPDLVNRPLLSAAFETDLPVLLSTGAALPGEIDRAVAWSRRSRDQERLVLLHCVSSYPTPPANANLQAIHTLRQRYRLPVGYSDHTESVDAGALAAALGACVIEKHFTLGRTQPGPDHHMSLEPTDLTEYVSGIRRAETLLGTGTLGCAAVEQDVRRVARRSIVAGRDIAAGETLTIDMLAIKRPAGGISPDHLDEILGCQVNCDTPRDTPLGWKMLQAQPEVQPGPATRDSQHDLDPITSARVEVH